MRSSYGGGLTFLFTALTSQLSLPSSLTLTNSNLTDPSALLLLTGQNSTSLNTFPSVSSKSGITCMKVHGENLKTDSCRNAWQKIPRTPNTQRFIPRKRSGEASSADVVLPIRYLSDDGICAIDLTLSKNSDSDMVTEDLISQKADAVLKQCVVRQRTGGIAVDFSRANDLKITVRSYEPSVDCEPRPNWTPSEDDCQAVLTKVPASRDRFLFGNGHSWRTVPGTLPREFYIGESEI